MNKQTIAYFSDNCSGIPEPLKMEIVKILKGVIDNNHATLLQTLGYKIIAADNDYEAYENEKHVITVTDNLRQDGHLEYTDLRETLFNCTRSE